MEKQKEEMKERAKQMLIDGSTYDAIMSETSLRLKDIKRIQKEEISNKF